MTIAEALKDLIKTITGKDAAGETVAELLNALNNEYPEGGGGGGSVVVDDEITQDGANPVTGGAIYEALAANAPLIVPATTDVQNEAVEITGDMSLSDIYGAASTGRTVYLETSLDTGNITRAPLVSYTYAEDEYEFVFNGIGLSSGKPMVLSWKFENSTTGIFKIGITD